MKRCVRCIIPDTFGKVNFNEKGVCQFCDKYQLPDEPIGKEELLKLFNNEMSSGGSKYDCVIPVSGGKDSIFVLYYVVKELKKRPLVITSDNGFTHPIAKENIINACNILNVPFIIRSPGAIHKTLIRQVLSLSEITETFIRKFCVNCGELHTAAAYWAAKNHGIKLILWGSDPIESARAYDRLVLGGSRTNLRTFNRIIKRFKEMQLDSLKLLPFIYYLAKFLFLSTQEKLLMGIPVKFISRGFYFPEGPPKKIDFYKYIRWDSLRQTELLKRELNWHHPEGKESRFDCLLHCFGDHRFLQSLGISWNGLVLCNFIRAGHITRKEAIEKEKQVINSVEKECQNLIQELGINDYRMPKIKLKVS